MQIKLTSGKAITAQPGESILKALKDNGVYLVASCGGKGVCGKCRVKVLEGTRRIEATGKLSREELDSGLVLACRTFPEGDLLVEIPEESKLVIGDKIAISKSEDIRAFLHSIEAGLQPAMKRIYLEMEPPTIQDHTGDLERVKRALSEKGLDSRMRFSHDFVAAMGRALREMNWKVNVDFTEDMYAVSISSPEQVDRYGLAIDIGTTTVVVYLVNCSDGSLIDLGTTYNSQMRHGDDVITRIVYATERGGLDELRSEVVNDVNVILSPLMERHAIDPNAIDSVVISGNTTMAHLFWGFDPSSIREEPYVPTLNNFPIWQAGTAGINILAQAPVYTIPCIGSYVGGDIVSGILASRMYLNPEIALFMDIGTNGEIAIGNNEWLMTAACSMGPCFEGSGIRNGMRATEGAIESVRIDPETLEPVLGVIGNVAPSGICGSGMIDAISELFFSGVIDQKGKFVRDIATDRVKMGNEGPEFVLFRGELKEIILTEVDVENVLRAKAALYAGISTLLKDVGLSLETIDRIYIAGGFGNYLNVDKAVMIGMLPDLPREKFSFIGNTSIAGAYLCLLSERMRREAEGIAAKMTYIELSVSTGFMDEYMSALFLPHTDMDLFPTVKQHYRR